MSLIVMKGMIRHGQVIVEEPINLPDGSEVTITAGTPGEFVGQEDDDRPMMPEEIAQTLAAMEKMEPFDFTPEEEAAADAWEKKVNEHTIATMDKGIEDVFP